MKQTCLFVLIFIFFSCCKQSGDTQIVQQTEEAARGLVAQHAMVVSAHPLATEVGLNILKSGGNAIDAAVAVQFALAVVYPVAGNIGGGGFMVFRSNDGEFKALDFRETAPAAAHRDLFLDDGGTVIPGLSLNSHLASGVPGTVEGMERAHRELGKLDWKLLVQPAIDLAQRGFALTEKEASRLNDYAQPIKERNSLHTYSHKSTWQSGDSLILPMLAKSLERIRDRGAAGFYQGVTADAIVAEMKEGNGIITHQDLANYRSKWREPVEGEYKELKIVSMCPPSSGGIFLIQMLKMIEAFPIAEWGHNSVQTMHLMAEIERRAYADRASYLGDPDFYEVPMAGLLDEQYIENRIANFDAHQAGNSVAIQAGDPFKQKRSAVPPKESEETTHYSIVDEEGNAVSITTTLNAAFGSKIVVDGAGFFLNNQMDDFSAKPGVPNLYGLVGDSANAIEPGKRMLSSMTPTIVEMHDELYMVVGTPGGSTIITSVFQNILNVYEFELGMQTSVSVSRFHHQWLPDQIFYEPGISDSTLSKLRQMGHTTQEKQSIGRVDAILALPEGGYEGGADPRGDDHAMGY